MKEAHRIVTDRKEKKATLDGEEPEHFEDDKLFAAQRTDVEHG